MNRTLGVKKVMVDEEKRLYERRTKEEMQEYYRKRKIRDEIDHGKRQFIHLKLES